MSDRAAIAYTPTAKALHWTIVLLVTIQFVTALAMPDIGPHTQPDSWISLHFSFGVLILAVMAARLIHRLMYPVPLEASQAPAWERFAALFAHRLFYLILLVGPLLGWASASAHRLTVSLFGLVTLPAIAAPKARWGPSPSSSSPRPSTCSSRRSSRGPAPISPPSPTRAPSTP